MVCTSPAKHSLTPRLSACSRGQGTRAATNQNVAGQTICRLTSCLWPTQVNDVTRSVQSSKGRAAEHVGVGVGMGPVREVHLASPSGWQAGGIDRVWTSITQNACSCRQGTNRSADRLTGDACLTQLLETEKLAGAWSVHSAQISGCYMLVEILAHNSGNPPGTGQQLENEL